MSRILWSERYEREMTDIFAIQDDISQAIANALKVKLAVTRRSTTNVEAFQSYLKGLTGISATRRRVWRMAKESFERVLRQDPNCAPAYAGLAVYYYGLGALGIQRMTEMAPLAKAAAESALAIDGTLSEATAYWDWWLAPSSSIGNRRSVIFRRPWPRSPSRRWFAFVTRFIS
jgi:hypothetical protein